MKKRLRKKLHKGEFRQYGISIMVPVTVNNVDAALDTLTEIADRHHILFCGGGLGYIALPSEKYGGLTIPSKAAFLATNISLRPEMLSDCIVGYFIHPEDNEITVDVAKDVANKVKEELQSALRVDFKINCRISLWN